MEKVNNFDTEKYKALLERLGNCRRGVRSNTFYEGLSCIVPGGYISSEMISLLDKWSATNQRASWSHCHQIAQDIRYLLLGR